MREDQLFYEYLSRKHLLRDFLNNLKFVQERMLLGMEFQTTGKLKRTDFLAKVELTLNK